MHFSTFARTFLTIAAVGCGGSAPQGPSRTKTAVANPTPAPARDADNARVRSFAELVRQATQRDGRAQHAADCLFELHDDGLILRGDVLGAVRPLPMPSLDLDQPLLASVSINLLTPFGRYGDAPGALSLVSFSYAPATTRAVAIVVTDRGVYVRGTSASVPALNAATAQEAARAVAAVDKATVYIAAEAEVSTKALVDVLQALDTSRLPVALAVNLTSDTTLPNAVSEPLAPLCPDGLSVTNDAEGDLNPSTLSATLSQFRERAADCMESADAAGAAGGHVTLAMRVGNTGSVSEACLQREETGDARLRACLLREAKKLQFPAPQPAGSVDLALPLLLQSRKPPAPKPLCVVERML